MIDPVSIYFNIEPTDHLGKNKVTGKVRFLSAEVELSWRLEGNVFTGGGGDIQTVLLPYGEIESVEVVKKWFSVKKIILRVGDPTLLGDMPSIELGKMELVIDKRSKGELDKLSQLIDYKRSEFILDMHDKNLEMLRNSE